MYVHAIKLPVKSFFYALPMLSHRHSGSHLEFLKYAKYIKHKVAR